MPRIIVWRYKKNQRETEEKKKITKYTRILWCDRSLLLLLFNSCSFVLSAQTFKSKNNNNNNEILLFLFSHSCGCFIFYIHININIYCISEFISILMRILCNSSWFFKHIAHKCVVHTCFEYRHISSVPVFFFSDSVWFLFGCVWYIYYKQYSHFDLPEAIPRYTLSYCTLIRCCYWF